MACAKDGTQVAIGIHLKSTLLSFCPVFCFVLFYFVCLVVFCVLLFVVFVFAFLLVCARSRQSDSFMDYVKVHTISLCGFSCMTIQFPASKSLCNDLAKASEALDGKKTVSPLQGLPEGSLLGELAV